MKIVNRQTFLSLPAMTVFSKYDPFLFGTLKVKWSNEKDEHDFIASDLVGDMDCSCSEEYSDKLELYEKTGESFSFSLEETCRDGEFNEDQLFCVYEQKDVQQLIDFLQQKVLPTFKLKEDGEA